MYKSNLRGRKLVEAVLNKGLNMTSEGILEAGGSSTLVNNVDNAENVKLVNNVQCVESSSSLCVYNAAEDNAYPVNLRSAQLVENWLKNSVEKHSGCNNFISTVTLVNNGNDPEIAKHVHSISSVESSSSLCIDNGPEYNAHPENLRGSHSHFNNFTQDSAYTYATLQNVQPEVNQKSDDFSCGSDDIFVPQDSSTSSSHQNLAVEENLPHLGQQNTEEFQEPTAKKQKIFKPKENRSKKRLRNENLWKKKLATLSREKGEEYLSYKNTVVPKKTIKEGFLCHEKCRLKCSTNFTLDDRKSILKSFYSLDVNSKNSLLFNSIVSKPVARERKNARKHKTATYKYFVKYQGVTKEVCKMGLCGLYQIGRKKIDHVIDGIKSGISAPLPDRRGKHDSRPHKIEEDVVGCVKAHIASFPAEQSHYSRNKNIHKLYLSPLLNVTKMHTLYLEMCEEKNLPASFKVKKSSYNKIFITNFNLSFGYPKSDTCATCDAGSSNEEHKENYYAAVEAMRVDRKKPEQSEKLLYITVDLQQTMPLPKLTVCKAFYLRQLWFYNLGIHVIDGKKEKAVCCTWTEDVANRGSSEVSSSLLRFIEVDPSCQNKDHLIVWSDSCAGQNKNFNTLALYQYIIKKGYFKIIDHKFPEVGHSYLDSDRDFGRIEKVLRKHESVYAADQYREIIRKASRNNTVINMADHFRKIDELQDKLNLINRKKDENNGKVCFRDGIKWIRVEEYGSYLYKESYDEMTPFKKVDILKKRGHSDSDFVIQRVEGKYGNITEEKKENIREQLQFIKQEYRYYYESIVSGQ